MTSTVADASKRFELLNPKTAPEFELYGSCAGHLMMTHHKSIGKNSAMKSSDDFIAMLTEFMEHILDGAPHTVLKEAEKQVTAALNVKIAAAHDPTKKIRKQTFMRVDGGDDIPSSEDEEEKKEAAAAKASAAGEADNNEGDAEDDDDQIFDEAAAARHRQKEAEAQKAREAELEAKRKKYEEEQKWLEEQEKKLEAKKRVVEPAFDPNLMLKRDDDDFGFGGGKGKSKGGKKR